MTKFDWEYEFDVIMEAFQWMASNGVSDQFLGPMILALPNKEWQYTAEIRVEGGRMELDTKKNEIMDKEE